MSTKLTAQDFKEPLLKVLGNLTDKKPDFPIDLKTTYEPVCQMMDITVDQFGDDPSSKKPKVEKWIQWAFKDHKNNGYTKTIGRGQWALTAAGVQIMNTTNTTPADDTTATPTVLDFSNVKTDDCYHNDDYIRTLAAQETKCFGFFAQQSPICGDCPLNAACMNAMMAELVTISTALAQKDEKEAAKAKAAATVTSTGSSSGTSRAIPKTAPSGETDLVLIHQASVCSKCGKTIPKGTKAWWVSSSTDGNAGLYHPECFDGDAD